MDGLASQKGIGHISERVRIEGGKNEAKEAVGTLFHLIASDWGYGHCKLLRVPYLGQAQNG